MTDEFMVRKLQSCKAEKALLKTTMTVESVVHELQSCKADEHKFTLIMSWEHVFVTHPEVEPQGGHFPTFI
jgi:hypothetical protein